MLERRIQEYEQILGWLNQCNNASVQGREINDGWPHLVMLWGRDMYSTRLDGQAGLFISCFSNIDNVVSQYTYFPDIKDWIHSIIPIKEVIIGSAKFFAEAIRSLPEIPPEQTIRLTKEQRDSFQNGLNIFDKWIEDTKIAVTTRIQDETKTQ